MAPHVPSLCCIGWVYQDLEGYIEIVDRTGRATLRQHFKNIAPQMCDVQTADNSLQLATDGVSSTLVVDGAFFGERTWYAGVGCLFCVVRRSSITSSLLCSCVLV